MCHCPLTCQKIRFMVRERRKVLLGIGEVREWLWFFFGCSAKFQSSFSSTSLRVFRFTDFTVVLGFLKNHIRLHWFSPEFSFPYTLKKVVYGRSVWDAQCDYMRLSNWVTVIYLQWSDFLKVMYTGNLVFIIRARDYRNLISQPDFYWRKLIFLAMYRHVSAFYMYTSVIKTSDGEIYLGKQSSVMKHSTHIYIFIFNYFTSIKTKTESDNNWPLEV